MDNNDEMINGYFPNALKGIAISLSLKRTLTEQSSTTASVGKKVARNVFIFPLEMVQLCGSIVSVSQSGGTTN